MAARVIEPELMDAPDLDAGRHHRALRGLRRLNAVSFAAGGMVRAVESLLNGRGRAIDGPVRILDIASGAGDIPVAVARGLASRGRTVEVTCTDVSGTALEHARTLAASRGVSLGFQRLDALRDAIPPGCDIVTCSLFLHHLREERIVDLLRRMAESASIGIVVNDLVRSRVNELMIRAGAWVVTGSPIVHVDAVRSIRAALTRDELGQLALQAGLAGHRIGRGGVCRMMLRWERPGESDGRAGA